MSVSERLTTSQRSLAPRPQSLTGRVTAPAGPSASFSSVLSALGREVDQGERVVRRASRGVGAVDTTQLLALQAAIYRYGEAVELASKVAERAAAAVKTTLQSGQG